MCRILSYFLLLSALGLGLAAHGDGAKIVLVTGAYRGLGLEIGKKLLEKGHRVVFAGRDLADAPIESRENPNAFPVTMDMSNSASIEAGFNQVIEHFGAIDVVVHNAGTMAMSPGQKVSSEMLQNSMAVNYLGPVHLTQLALPYFRERKFGRVIYISSAAAIMREEHLAAYASSKAASETFFRTLDKDIRADESFKGVDLDISVLRLSFVRGEYRPEIVGVNETSMTRLMAWFRANSPTSTHSVSELVARTITDSNAPEFVNVGLDGLFTRTVSLLPHSLQKSCSDFLIRALSATGQIKK